MKRGLRSGGEGGPQTEALPRRGCSLQCYLEELRQTIFSSGTASGFPLLPRIAETLKYQNRMSILRNKHLQTHTHTWRINASGIE